MSAVTAGVRGAVLNVVIGRAVTHDIHALLNGAVVGRVTVRLGKATAHVSRLFVHADFRGRGIGSWLLAECERYAGANFRASVSLMVDRGNEGVFGFYKKHGYVPVFEWEDGDTLLARALSAPGEAVAG